MYAQSVLTLAALSFTGCAFGIGPSSAANRQAPDGFMGVYRVMDIKTGNVMESEPFWSDQWKSPVGLHGGVRKGWWKGGLDGRPSTGGDMTELHWDLTFVLAAFGVGISYLSTTNDTGYSEGVTARHEASGFAGQFSYALAPFVSVDTMIGRVSGPLKVTAGTAMESTDATATRFSIGTTLRLVPILGLRFDVNHIAADAVAFGRDVGWGAWGVSVEGVISLF